MKTVAFAVLLASLPLSAQSWELGLFAGQQSYKSVGYMGVTVEAKNKTVLAARIGYSVVDLGPALFQVTAGFQPKVDADVTVNGFADRDKFQQQHMSLGAMFNFKAALAVGLGLEYRMEKLNGTNSGIGDVSYNRPWVRGHLGYAFPTPVLKPFMGLEVAMPLTSTSFNINGSDEDGMRAFAPKLQFGIYGGIRF